MSVISNNQLAGASGQGDSGYVIRRSLRFNSGDSAHLSRTPSSAGNRKTWTWSGWVKRTDGGTDKRGLFGVNSTNAMIRFNNDDGGSNLRVLDNASGGYDVITKAKFRDPSAWYHFVVSVDTTESTAADRVKIYVNGVREDTFYSASYPTQNQDLTFNTAAQHNIGRTGSSNNEYLNAYLADVHFIDGQALAPTDFGEPDADTGVWIPKKYSGSYGTNGFHLDFSDTSDLGNDVAGSNNWTPNNFSVASGAGNDSLIDTPTNYDAASGNNGGNYATLNPLQKSSGSTLSNGNLDISMSSAQGTTFATMAFPATGKWYFECTANATQCDVGIAKADASLSQYVGKNSSGYGYYVDGNVYNNDASAGSGASYTTGDVIGVAFDADAGTCKWYKNNALQVTVSSLSGEWFPAFGSGSAAGFFNFGSRPFAYTPPTGHKSLCTTNLSEPTIKDGSTVMDVVKYNGTAATQVVTGLSYEPDLVWLKRRDSAGNHNIQDQVRGASAVIQSDYNGAEFTNGPRISSFNSNGFTLTSDNGANASGGTYVGWTWDGGTTTATNTAGDIQASVRANQSAGFSIVKFTASGSYGMRSIGHGLGAKPSLVISKRTDGSGDWLVHTDVTGSILQLDLNTTDASAAASSYYSANTSTFSLYHGHYMDNGYEFINYCFAPVSQYSAIGSYTGSGSNDGSFIFTGFAVRWLMIKCTSDAGQEWVIIDSARSPFNVADDALYANDGAAEATNSTRDVDLLSNGFKLRNGSSGATDFSNRTYIYLAFAESPLKYSRAV